MGIKNYKGVDYVVFVNDRGGLVRNYCAYVRLPKGHPFIKILRRKVLVPGFMSIKPWYRRSYDKVPVECHYGLTFGDLVKEGEDWAQGFTPGWWIGWDYAHFCDDIYTEEMKKKFSVDGLFDDLSLKKWTEEEVEKEVFEVIEQVINYEKN